VNESGVAESAISLPEGRGTIRGIGETFTPELTARGRLF
jgi:hypothetical protein